MIKSRAISRYLLSSESNLETQVLFDTSQLLTIEEMVIECTV